MKRHDFRVEIGASNGTECVEDFWALTFLDISKEPSTRVGERAEKETTVTKEVYYGMA